MTSKLKDRYSKLYSPFTDNLEGVIVTNYQIIAEVGVVLYLESTEKQATCTCCGGKSSKLHQNNELTIRDLPWGDQAVYLKINRRQLKCKKCGKKFLEELSYVQKKRTYTDRLRNKIIQEVLNGDLKNTAERNGFSEQEVETMLKDLGEELRTKNRYNIAKFKESLIF